MTTQDFLVRLAPSARRILNLDEFTEATSMDTTASWTSLRHVQLLSEIERVFQIQIADKDAFRLTSCQRILNYLKEHLSSKED